MATDRIDVEQADNDDLAEVFDETNLIGDSEDIVETDELPDVYDVTQIAEDSADPDDVLPEFDDENGPKGVVGEEDDDEEIYGEDDIEQGPARRASPAPDPHVEKALDEGIEETFPASDPVSISPGPD